MNMQRFLQVLTINQKSATRQFPAVPALLQPLPALPVQHQPDCFTGTSMVGFILHLHWDQAHGCCTHDAAAFPSPVLTGCRVDAGSSQWGAAPGLRIYKLYVHCHCFPPLPQLQQLCLYHSSRGERREAMAAWTQFVDTRSQHCSPLVGTCIYTAAKDLGAGRSGSSAGTHTVPSYLAPSQVQGNPPAADTSPKPYNLHCTTAGLFWPVTCKRFLASAIDHCIWNWI